MLYSNTLIHNDGKKEVTKTNKTEKENMTRERWDKSSDWYINSKVD